MKRKALLAIAAAGAVAAIVVLTTGAFGGTSRRSDQPGDGNGAFISCLASHGVQVPSDDPGAVKRWLGDHESDPAVQAALQACAPPDDTGTDLTPAELAACLEQHGVDVPSDTKQDPGALKQWLHGAMQQPSVRAAVDQCAGGEPPQKQGASPAPTGQKK
jgi:hypothetical protein